jgi:hypothetical protein
MRAALVREQFPGLMANPGIVYLDSAATVQKPPRVIDAVTAHLAGQTANPGRGAYPWSTRAAGMLAGVRERTARFIGAESPDEIVFVPGATAGLNAVATSWRLANLADGDEILFSPLDHSSNMYPWINLQQVLARFGWARTSNPGPMSTTSNIDQDCECSSPTLSVMAGETRWPSPGRITKPSVMNRIIPPQQPASSRSGNSVIFSIKGPAAEQTIGPGRFEPRAASSACLRAATCARLEAADENCGLRSGMPASKRPAPRDALTATQILLDGLARDAASSGL